MVVGRSFAKTSDIEFQGKHSGEKFYFQYHQHWIRLVWPFVKLLLWNSIIFSIVFSVFVMTSINNDFTRHLTMTFLSLFFVLAHLEFLTKFYRYLLYVVVVTDKKIHRIKKTLLMTDAHFSVDLWMVQDIQKLQTGLLQNILGFGTIILQAQDTVMRLHFVPNITEKSEKIMHLREQARSQMAYSGGEKTLHVMHS